MKRFLLSILCSLLVCVNIHAEEVTKSVTFSNYTAGEQYAENEKHDLDGGLVIYTTLCHFTSELRIYSSSTFNGYVVSDALPGPITKMTFNAGYKKDVLIVYGSSDGSSWETVGKVNVNSTSYKDYSLVFPENSSYTYFKLDVEGSNQVRLKSMSVTYNAETVKETVVTPQISPASTTFNKGEKITVAISTETEDATIYYTTDGKTPTVGSSPIYSTPFDITQSTIVKAIAVKDECNNSAVAEVLYTMVYPNAVEVTISFANDSQRVSQDVNSQVWENNNITFTNNKSNSQTNVADYINPVRLYQGSNIVVECGAGNITQIVFDCNNSEYATILKNSIGGTVKAEGDKVTVPLDGTSNSYTVTSLGAKVHLDAITLTYVEIPWGSLYYPVPVEIPSSVKAYIVTAANNSYVTLQQVTGVLPASTGVIYNGEWGSPVVTLVEVDDVEGNLLKGTAAATLIEEEAFVLAKVDGEVGFYKAAMNQQDGTAFLNNANKAYLPASALPASVQGANGFKFRFETTGVEGVQVAQGKKVIFDLSGRKVSDMTAPGVYIVNGKKVLVK